MIKNQIMTNNTGKLSVITGSMYSGKCLQRGTPILMWNGLFKKVEEIVEGDQLMGDDSHYRTVLCTTHGIGPLYRVTQSYGDPYVVNQYHLLSLQDPDHRFQTIEIRVSDFIRLNPTLQRSYKGYHIGVDYPSQIVPYDPQLVGRWLGRTITQNEGSLTHHPLQLSLNWEQLPLTYLVNSRENRLHLLQGLFETNGLWDPESQQSHLIITQESWVSQIVQLIRSLGLRVNIQKRLCLYGMCTSILVDGSVLMPNKGPIIQKEVNLTSDLVIEPLNEGEYYGFTLDGNGRFLLGDFTVTHNSTELQRQVNRLKLAGKSCLVIKHAKDQRYGKNEECCTHDLRTIPAVPTQNLWELIDKCHNYDVIGIDEGQFFPEIVEFVDQLIETMGKHVIVAALDSTFEGNPFGRIIELLPKADDWIKLKAICQRCGSDAPFTIRRSDYHGTPGVIEVVGASEIYEAVCRRCRSEQRKKIV